MGTFDTGGVYCVVGRGYHGLREDTDISKLGIDGSYSHARNSLYSQPHWRNRVSEGNGVGEGALIAVSRGGGCGALSLRRATRGNNGGDSMSPRAEA